MEHQRIAKQMYLQKEILDKGIDPEHFQEFCEKIQGEESDIDKWSFEQIQKLVTKYKIDHFSVDFNTQQNNVVSWDQNINIQESNDIQNNDFTNAFNQFPSIQLQQQQQQQQEEQQLNTEQQQQQQEQKTEQIKIDEVQQNQCEEIQQQQITNAEQPKMVEVSQQQSQDTQQCQRLGINIFGKENIEIKITGSEIKSGGLFKTDYVLYQIQCGEYKVHRRFSDFEWLRRMLHKIFPGFGLPALTFKTMKKTAVQTINRRTHQLEYFLNELTRIDVFRNSKYFVDFLKITDPKQFKELVHFGDKVQKQKQFSSLLNMSGQIHFVKEANFKNIEQLIYHEEPIYEKIKDLYKTITKHLKGIVKLLQEVQEQFTHLHQLGKKLEMPQMQYEELAKCNKNLEEQIQLKNENQYMKMLNLFRFQTANFNQIKEVLKQRNELSIEFNQRKDYKDQPRDLKADELDFPSKNTNILAYQLGFMNWRAQEETHSFLENRSTLFKKHIQQIV